jgi:hypothetical protein
VSTDGWERSRHGAETRPLERGFSLRDCLPQYQEPEPPRLNTSGDIDRIFRQAEQAQRAQQQRHETENEPLNQLTRTDLKTMTPAQIEQARKAGQLDDLLRGGPPQADLSGAELRIKQLEYDGITQLTQADLQSMTSAQISAATREGRFTAILSGISPAVAEREPDASEAADAKLAAAQRWRDAVHGDG